MGAADTLRRIGGWFSSVPDTEIELPPIELHTKISTRSLGCAIILGAALLGGSVVAAAATIPTFYVVQHVGGRCP